LGDLFQKLCLRKSHALGAPDDDEAQDGNTDPAPRVKIINEPREQVHSLALHEAAFDGT
jgi:hypothetical protein